MSNGKGGKKRPLPWLQAESAAARTGKYSAALVEFASSKRPSGAYDAAREHVFLDSGDAALAEQLAKACRWLAVIRRDYGQAAFEHEASAATTQP